MIIVVAVIGLIGAVALGVMITRPSGQSTAQVGADLHAVTADGQRVFVSGHDGAAYSDDPGFWTPITSLAGKDAMAWVIGSNDVIVAGHEGVFRSTDKGASFSALTNVPVTDVHAAGAAGKTAYIASPTKGFFASGDGGQTWKPVGSTGQSFMGQLLVDAQDPMHVIAADALLGVVETRDGGLTWKTLGASNSRTN